MYVEWPGLVLPQVFELTLPILITCQTGIHMHTTWRAFSTKRKLNYNANNKFCTPSSQQQLTLHRPRIWPIHVYDDSLHGTRARVHSVTDVLGGATIYTTDVCWLVLGWPAPTSILSLRLIGRTEERQQTLD